MFGQTSTNPYNFDENKYDYNTQKELGLSVLEKFKDFNEAEYLEEFVLNKEVMSYSLYEYLIKQNVNFENINFEEGLNKSYSSTIEQNKFRVNSIIEKIKKQNVKLSECKIDSSFSKKDNLYNDTLEGSITIYLSDENDHYRFQITGLNRIKGKWFIAEPHLYWHNEADIKLIKQIDKKFK